MASVTHTATIASGGTTSNACDLGALDYGQGLAGFVLPASFTGTAITFQVSVDDSTYQALYNSNTQLSITVAQGRSYGFSADTRSLLFGWRFVKLISGSTEGGERAIKLLVR
jgi:hypothetical protein